MQQQTKQQLKATKGSLNLGAKIYRALNDPQYFDYFALLLLAFECVLNVLVVQKIAYTEIDWVAYMEEVTGVLVEGHYDYLQLKGNTGPLVYPAGFVWLYSALYYLTDKGTDIRMAQYIFCVLHVLFLGVVFLIYRQIRDKIPPWILVLVCMSRRIHSIFVLRLFNDCFAMLFLYLSIYLLLKKNWSAACLVYSLGLSIKMNVLLFAPAFGLVLVKSVGWLKTIIYLSLSLLVQIGLAWPFLTTYPASYFNRAFEFGRQFIFKWSVNWQFVGEDTFLTKEFALLLMGAHLLVLFLFAERRWTLADGGLLNVILQKFSPKSLANDYVVRVLFVCNFVGIVFARTLHYQFYVWYFHTLPFLLWSTSLPVLVKMGLWGVIEVIWNIFPPRPATSAVLLLCHLTILIALWSSSSPSKKVARTTKQQ
eukprot:TRINITY_DN2222_c0_g2_i2.p1 TRINITY_DN2222_c0_g2~~TRINITY_DN2222_c0_g2_i2.p1  ORF type:complete len:422 (-),score=74.69 TRINITY_DN2222_c0_g2_i2:136-1401(-)